MSLSKEWSFEQTLPTTYGAIGVIKKGHTVNVMVNNLCLNIYTIPKLLGALHQSLAIASKPQTKSDQLLYYSTLSKSPVVLVATLFQIQGQFILYISQSFVNKTLFVPERLNDLELTCCPQHQNRLWLLTQRCSFLLNKAFRVDLSQDNLHHIILTLEQILQNV